MLDYAKALREVENALERITFPKEPSELYEPIRYFLKLGGKRLRPILVLLAADLFEKKDETILSTALTVELFHNFTLIHDDIMDEAPVRRGKATVHEKWNRDVAILSGDAMMIKAYELLALTHSAYLPGLLSVFNKTAFEVCEGQQMDMSFETQEEVSAAHYLRMIELKTAVLLAASLKMGAMAAGQPMSIANDLYEFGRNIGIAFQLKDDWLDLYADPEKFGKQIGGDIITGKKTYLMIKALELANQEQRAFLLKWIKPSAGSNQERVARVKGLFDELGVGDLLNREMEKYFSTGLSFLNKINASEERKEGLRSLAETLMGRES